MRAYPLVLIALALLAGTAGYVVHRATRGPAAPQLASVGAAADIAQSGALLDTTFSTLDGHSRSLSSWPGTVVVLNFWATWCPPCLKEIPAFIDLQQRYGDQGLQFIGIALDQSAAVVPFVAAKAINYPVLIGADDVARFMQQLGNSIGGLPYTVVVVDGEVVYRHQGEWSEDAADETLRTYLKVP